jgi:hypothetical protein
VCVGLIDDESWSTVNTTAIEGFHDEAFDPERFEMHMAIAAGMVFVAL